MSEQNLGETTEETGSEGLHRRTFVLGGGLALAGLSYEFLQPASAAKIIEEDEFRASIPSNVGGWTSRKTSEIVLPRLDGNAKLYQNLETRIYEGEGLPSIMFCIAYNNVQQNDVHVHRPEVCYPAAGFPIKRNSPINLTLASKSVSARELVADRSGLNERIIYWIRVGGAFPDTWFKQRLVMAQANLGGTIPDGVLFRVSLLESQDESYSESLKLFISSFMAATQPAFRDKVIL